MNEDGKTRLAQDKLLLKDKSFPRDKSFSRDRLLPLLGSRGQGNIQGEGEKSPLDSESFVVVKGEDIPLSDIGSLKKAGHRPSPPLPSRGAAGHRDPQDASATFAASFDLSLLTSCDRVAQEEENKSDGHDGLNGVYAILEPERDKDASRVVAGLGAPGTAKGAGASGAPKTSSSSSSSSSSASFSSSSNLSGQLGHSSHPGHSLHSGLPNSAGSFSGLASGFPDPSSGSSDSSSDPHSGFSQPLVDASDFLPLPGEPTTVGLYSDPNLYAKLDAFFAALNMDSLNRHGFAAELQPFILKIFTQEMSTLELRGHSFSISWLKLVWLDNLVERCLQGLVLSRKDVNPTFSSSSCPSSCIAPRAMPSEHQLLVKTTWGMAKALGARGFARGIDFALRGTVHWAVLGMTAYRAWLVLSVGDTDFTEFTDIFKGSDSKGIISLVHILAKRPPWQSELIGPGLIVLAFLYGLWAMREAGGFTSKEIKERAKQMEEHVNQPPGWRRGASRLVLDVGCEFVPGLCQLFAYSPSLKKLERASWDGRSTIEDKKRMFDMNLMVARKGSYFLWMEAFRSLTKRAQGVGFADYRLLQEANYPTEVLQALTETKATALAELQAAADGKGVYGEADPSSWALTARPRIWIVRLYAHYCMWKLAHTTSWWARLLFPPTEGFIWYFGIMVFVALVYTVLEAIHCPDREVTIGFGYSIGADLFGLPCFNELIEQFRSVDLSQPVSDLIQQMQYFDLRGFTTLQLYLMNLTGSEMVQIARAAEARGAQITTLDIWDHFYDEDMRVLATQFLANNTVLQAFWLGSTGGNSDSGGEQLTNRGFQYLVDVVSSMLQLTYFDIGFPNVDSAGMLPLTRVINATGLINRFYIETSSIDDVAGVPLMEALSTLPIVRTIVSGSGIGDATVRAAQALVQNSQGLTELWINGDAITDEGASSFAQMISGSSLDTIGLESGGITDVGLTTLAESLASFPVQTLGIGSNGGEGGVVTLINSLNQTAIWHLQVVNQMFTVDSMRALSDNLPLTSIIDLGLINNYLNSETLSLLASGIAASSITLLAIFDSDLSNLLGLLAPSLVNVQQFTLTNCNLTNADVEILAFYLPSYRQMTRLNLINCGIGDEGATALAQALPRTGITYLDLSNNFITNTGARALADVYPSTSLETLLLKDNDQISDDDLYEIESYRLERYCQDQVCREGTQWSNSGAQGQMNPSAVGFLGFSHSGYFPSYTIFSRIAGSSPSAMVEAPIQDITPVLAGSLIIGVTVLGVLIYKNTSGIQALAKKTLQCGYQLWQWCKGTTISRTRQNKSVVACSLFDSHYESISPEAEREVKSLSSHIRTITH